MRAVNSGSRLFDRFLTKNGISNRRAATALKHSFVTVRAWRKGLARPDSEEKRKAVEVYTNGFVPHDAWLKSSEQKALEGLRSIQPFTPDEAADAG